MQFMQSSVGISYQPGLHCRDLHQGHYQLYMYIKCQKLDNAGFTTKFESANYTTLPLCCYHEIFLNSYFILGHQLLNDGITENGAIITRVNWRDMNIF